MKALKCQSAHLCWLTLFSQRCLEALVPITPAKMRKPLTFQSPGQTAADIASAAHLELLLDDSPVSCYTVKSSDEMENFGLRPVDWHGSSQPTKYVPNLRWRLCRQNTPPDGFYRPPRRDESRCVIISMEHILKSENFTLIVKPEVFESDISYPSNTAMEIRVQSDDFSASTTMDIDVKELAQFAFDLSQIYETLSGEAIIKEPYGMHMYISFVGNGRGHIAVKGYLRKGNRAGHEQVLEFENEIDQTCLKEFCYALKDSYSDTY